MNKLLVTLLLTLGVSTNVLSATPVQMNSMCAAVYGAVGSVTNQQVLKDRAGVYFKRAIKLDPTVGPDITRSMQEIRQDLLSGGDAPIQAAKEIVSRCESYSRNVGF